MLNNLIPFPQPDPEQSDDLSSPHRIVLRIGRECFVIDWSVGDQPIRGGTVVPFPTQPESRARNRTPKPFGKK